jgi:hypothetical protein
VHFQKKIAFPYGRRIDEINSASKRFTSLLDRRLFIARFSLDFKQWFQECFIASNKANEPVIKSEKRPLPMKPDKASFLENAVVLEQTIKPPT